MWFQDLSADIRLGLLFLLFFSPAFELERFFNAQFGVPVLLFRLLIISLGFNTLCQVTSRT